MPSPLDLARGLRALPPRTASLLERRWLEGDSSGQLATLYGVSTAAMEVHLARAAHALLEALEGRAAPAPDGAPAGPRATQAVTRLAQSAAEVTQALRTLEAEEARSPRRRREELLRTLVVLALAALAVWLGAQQLAPTPARAPAPPAALP